MLSNHMNGGDSLSTVTDSAVPDLTINLTLVQRSFGHNSVSANAIAHVLKIFAQANTTIKHTWSCCQAHFFISTKNFSIGITEIFGRVSSPAFYTSYTEVVLILSHCITGTPSDPEL